MAQQLIQMRTPAAYAGVEAWARKHAGTDAASLAWLALGYAHLLDRDGPAASVALQKAKSKAGELADYVRFFQAQAQAAQSQNEAVIATLAGYDKNMQDSIFQRDAEVLYANALVASDRAAAAISTLEGNREPVRADVELALGRAYLKSPNPEKGMEILRHLYFTMPNSPEAALAATELQSRGSALVGSYQDRRTRIELLAKSNRWSDVARETRDLLNEAPDAERGNLQVLLGVALRRAGDANEGRRLLESATASGELNAQRLYNLGEIARNAEDENAVKSNLDRMRSEAATSPWLEQALMSAGNMYLLRKDYDRAIDLFRELCVRFPAGSRSSYAHWKAAWLTFRQDRKVDAKRDFEQQVEQYPSGVEVPASLYWRARLAEEDGDMQMARAWYAKCSQRFRNYYYGYLSGDRLRALPASAVNVSAVDYTVLDRIPPIPAPAEGVNEITPPADDLRAEKAKLLDNAGLTDFAVRELQAAEGGDGANWATLQIARIYAGSGQYHRALQFLKRSLPSYYSLDITDLPKPYWEFLFPTPYWPDIRRHASANGLNPYLVASLIRQESEFNPGAVSHANAYGLMQLLPTVGRGEARELRVRGFGTESLLNPTMNIELGTRYFKKMIDQFGGQVEYALAAYNAGTNRVDDWKAAGKYRDIAEFVESIPFTETREYVQAIMRNAQVYRRLYPQE